MPMQIRISASQRVLNGGTRMVCPRCNFAVPVALINEATLEYLHREYGEDVRFTPMEAADDYIWFICPHCGEEIYYDEWLTLEEYTNLSSLTPNPLNNLIKSEPLHKCLICGAPVTKHIDGMYLCDSCASPKNYSYANWQTAGRKTKKPTFAIEFETDSTPLGIYELLRHKYVPTKDSSIGGYEWKSPIYYDLASFKKVLPILDKYKEAVTSSCGTHVHVAISTFSKLAIIAHWDKVFGDIIDYIKLNKNTARKFWGRYFNDYCSAVGTGHHSAFSPSEKYDTLEYRLPRYVTAEQYYNVVKFCRDATLALDALIKAERAMHHVDYPDDMPRASMAQAGDILLKIYQSYTDKVEA